MTALARPAAPADQQPAVGFREALLFWLKLGFINFGGPTGQIAVMHEELVERRRWISEERFLHALNYCMLLPGPEAQQLAIYIGWLLHRAAGGLVAGSLFVLPGFLCMLALSAIYALHGNVPWIMAIFYGLRSAVIAIIAAAVLRIGSKTLRNPGLVAVSAAAFCCLFFLRVPFPLVIIGSALIGIVGSRFWPKTFRRSGTIGTSADAPTVIPDDRPQAEHTRPTLRRTIAVLVAGLAAWWLPLILVISLVGWQGVLTREAIFFSNAAMITFGGAYAVLAYINQAAVERYGWLASGQMMDGLGLAETTPGPLIMVAVFVGFMGAFNHPGSLSPLLAGTLGATVTVWATFAPCFLWIFLGAPFIERLRGNAVIDAAMSAITAAVVGVILNLAVWFALHAVFRYVSETNIAGPLVVPVPALRTLDPYALAIAVAGFIGIRRLHWGIIPTLAGCASAGLLRHIVAMLP